MILDQNLSHFWKKVKPLIILILLLSLTIVTKSYTQIKSKDFNDFVSAEKSISLVRNDFQSIPITKINNNKIGVICFSCTFIKEFQHDLSNYFPAEVYNSKESFEKWATKKDKFILSIDLENDNRNEVSQFLNSQLKPNSVFLEQAILVVFSSQENAQIPVEISDFPTMIFASKKNQWTTSIVAQAIFGAHPINGMEGDFLNKNKIRLGYAPPQTQQMDEAILIPKIDSLAENAIEKGAFPGAQILVAKSGKIVFHKAYGFHTFDGKRRVKLTDLYDFASVSKITTALPALMKLHGEQKFEIDKPLKTYFPKFKKSNKASLTYREILAHQAGLKPWIPYWTTTIKKNGKFKRRTFKRKYSKRYNVKITDDLYLHRKYKKKIYKAICKSPVSENKTYKYSGLAFYIFPEMVSNLTNMDFESYLKKNIYEPVGAFTLTYNPLRYFPLDQIVPTERDTFFRKIQIHGTVHDEGAIMMGGVSANAGLFGSATDLAKLMQMYLNQGTYGGQRIIAAESIQEFTRYQYPDNQNRRGLGFDKPLLEYDPIKSSVAKDASPSSYGHSGYTGTFVWVDPEQELIYIFFSNRVYPTRNNRKIYQLNVRPDIHQAIYDSIQK